MFPVPATSNALRRLPVRGRAVAARVVSRAGQRLQPPRGVGHRGRFVFDPVAFVGRLAVLVPRPRVNLLLYCGVLGARSAWRRLVVPGAQPARGDDGARAEPAATGSPDTGAAGTGRGSPWATLMARTFGLDVLACPRCGGRLRLVALIEQAVVIGRILRHLGVPVGIPPPRPG